MRASNIDLGFDGKNYPAERGLFISLLQETGIHVDGVYSAPSKGDTLYPLWRVADRLLSTERGVVGADEIIQAWGKGPIGLKAGLGPVFLSAYILSRRDRVAVYGEGIFQSSFNELCVEFLARDTKDIGLRRVEMEGFVGGHTRDPWWSLKDKGRLRTSSGRADNYRRVRWRLCHGPLEPNRFSPQTLRVREILKRASDPNKLLFDDLPRLSEPLTDGSFDANATAVLLRDALAEMRAAYPKVLDDLKELMLRELDVRSQSEDAFKALRDRADNIRNIGGDLRLEAFVGRVTQFHGTREDMEGACRCRRQQASKRLERR